MKNPSTRASICSALSPLTRPVLAILPTDINRACRNPRATHRNQRWDWPAWPLSLLPWEESRLDFPLHWAEPGFTCLGRKYTTVDDPILAEADGLGGTQEALSICNPYGSVTSFHSPAHGTAGLLPRPWEYSCIFHTAQRVSSSKLAKHAMGDDRGAGEKPEREGCY